MITTTIITTFPRTTNAVACKNSNSKSTISVVDGGGCGSDDCGDDVIAAITINSIDRLRFH